MNYTELLALLTDYAEADEISFVGHLPDYIRLAEERIYRFVKVPGLRGSEDLVCTIDSAELTLPADYISPDSLEVRVGTTWTNLTPKEVDFLSQAYPDDSDTGLPLYYAQFDNEKIHVAPIPDDDYPLRLRYTRKPESIVDAGETWLGNNAEVALLYGSLVEAYTYLKGEQDLLQLYEARFMEAVGQAKNAGDSRTRTDEWRNKRPLDL